jgi:hypothetical protein
MCAQTARQAAKRQFSSRVCCRSSCVVSHHLSSYFLFTNPLQAEGWVSYAEAQSIERALVTLQHTQGAADEWWWIACNNVRRFNCLFCHRHARLQL